MTMIKQAFISFIKYLGRLIITPLSLVGYLFIVYSCSLVLLSLKDSSTISDIIIYFLSMFSLFAILFFTTRYLKRLVKEDEYEDAPDEEKN